MFYVPYIFSVDETKKHKIMNKMYIFNTAKLFCYIYVFKFVFVCFVFNYNSLFFVVREQLNLQVF